MSHPRGPPPVGRALSPETLRLWLRHEPWEHVCWDTCPEGKDLCPRALRRGYRPSTGANGQGSVVSAGLGRFICPHFRDKSVEPAFLEGRHAHPQEHWEGHGRAGVDGRDLDVSWARRLGEAGGWSRHARPGGDRSGLCRLQAASFWKMLNYMSNLRVGRHRG